MSNIGCASSQFIPVIVGSKNGSRTARRLFWQYGLLSHLFVPRISLLHRLTPWLICHQLPTSSQELMVLALCDLAAEIESIDRTPLLYIGDDVPTLDPNHTKKLEGCFIVCRNDDPLILPKGGQAV